MRRFNFVHVFAPFIRLPYHKKMRRVVVTGLGLVSPLGCHVPTVWQRLLNQEVGTKLLSAVKPNPQDFASIPCKVAATVPRGRGQNEFDVDSVASKSDRKSLAMGMCFALHAAEQAVQDAKWTALTEEQKERTGVNIGMALLDMQDVVDGGADLAKNYNRLSPFFMPKVLPNLAGGNISIKYGFQGPNHCVSTACTTGLHAVGDAYRFIKHGDADVMVSGGADCSTNPLSIAAFSRMKALSTKFTDTPERSSRPFDRDRDGFVMGEGSAILVLEELEHALKRNAKIYCEVLGYGLSGDAHHISSPRLDGKGAMNCMKRSLAYAGLQPSDIGHVNCHATSTPMGDICETGAIRNVFGSEVPITSTKGATGHLLGAAGSIESVFTVLAVHTGVIPPVANLENRDELFKDLHIVHQKGGEKWTGKNGRRIALKNSFAFGGANASVVFAEHK